MQLSFTKMEGAGNDFMVIYDTNGGIILTNDQIKKLSNRHLGVGFDQLLLISKDSSGKADFFYQIFKFFT